MRQSTSTKGGYAVLKTTTASRWLCVCLCAIGSLCAPVTVNPNTNSGVHTTRNISMLQYKRAKNNYARHDCYSQYSIHKMDVGVEKCTPKILDRSSTSACTQVYTKINVIILRVDSRNMSWNLSPCDHSSWDPTVLTHHIIIKIIFSESYWSNCLRSPICRNLTSCS